MSDVALDAAPSLRRGITGARRWATPGVVLAVVVVLVIVGWWLVPSWFTDADPLVGVPGEQLQAPSWAHPFGTDQLGRDVYARSVYGAELSMRGALLAMVIAFGAGTVLGSVAGYLGGVVEDVIMRLVDVLLSIPGLLLSLMIVAALGFGTTKVAVAVGAAGIAGFARLARGEVLRVRTTDYVEAARASGSRWYSVLAGHVVPNTVAPLIVLAALDLSAAILAIAAMSFLGYGAPPPTPEWGTLIAQGRDHLATAWWISTMPGLVVMAVALAFNRLSRALDARRWAVR